MSADLDLSQVTSEVRAELGRVDTKAQTLLTLAGIALTVGIAVLSSNHLPRLAAVIGWVTLAVIAVAVAVLATAVRPALRGDHGFVRYARLAPDAVLAELNACSDDPGRVEHERYRLRWLSLATLAKFRRVRAAVDLLLVGLAGAAVTAVIVALA